MVPTPAFAKHPFFKVNDLVKCHSPSPYNSHLTNFKGYSIKAVAWMDRHKMHVYKVGPVDGEAIGGSVLEKDLSTSKYTVNDIVKFTAFGISNTRTIKEVLINDEGTFYYAIAGGFRIRDTDIAELVARR